MEETEDVVDSVCMEVLAHPIESRAPPAEAISLHCLPVVRGKTPVLIAEEHENKTRASPTGGAGATEER